MKEKKYQVRLEGIDLISKTMNQFQTSDSDEFNHLIKTQTVGDWKKNSVIVFVHVTISKKEAQDIKLAELVIGVGFIIGNYKDIMEKDRYGKAAIPDDLDNQLKSISISTMRGVMFSEFRGTQLHRASLPIVSMDTLDHKMETPSTKAK
ncbi:MAG: hypothetical protein KGM98_00955 [Bacteroidota bacterium]|nr:hypothetical protein [Bacteroidota bacterium]